MKLSESNIATESAEDTSSKLDVPPKMAETAWVAVVAEKVKSLRFGIIQITIHEGKVVQIDSTERTRLDITGGKARQSKRSE